MNREILARALDEMGRDDSWEKPSNRSRRGRSSNKGGSSALPNGPPTRQGDARGGAKRRQGPNGDLYGSGLAELWALFGANGEVVRLVLVLVDPERQPKSATRFPGDGGGASGQREPANYATAMTLTFLREALGVPLTQASDLYARLLGGAPHLSNGVAHDSASRPCTIPNETQMMHGLAVEIAQTEWVGGEDGSSGVRCARLVRASAGLFSLMSVMCSVPRAWVVARRTLPRLPRESSQAPSQGITFIEDDYEGAKKRALAEHLPMFVDAWAAWCHTCLSMKEYVWGDAALSAVATQVSSGFRLTPRRARTSLSSESSPCRCGPRSSSSTRAPNELRSNGQALRPPASSRSSRGTPLSTEGRTTKRPPRGSGGIGRSARRTPRSR